MSAVTLFSPAKINLFLAVVGKRGDGFHDLVSLVAPVDFGDTLKAELRDAPDWTLECDAPDLPVDETNLVLRAVRAFRGATGWKPGGHLVLTKRIPQGAGLGGGSSNATSTLLALNQLAGHPLSRERLGELAAGLGSDCPLFLEKGPVVIRGRGDRITPLPGGAGRLRGRRVWLFKPHFSVATPWAYARLAAHPGGYFPADEAEAWLARWLGDAEVPVEKLLFNSFEQVVFRKFVGLPVLVEALLIDFGLEVRMSGSGSTCFAFVPADWSAERRGAVRQAIKDAWGSGSFFVETTLL